MFFSDISNYLIDIQENRDANCNFMLIGDLNSRCGTLEDYVIDDADAYIPTLPSDYVPDIGLPRVTQDIIINSNGRRLIDFCKETSTRIANGRVCGDLGNCTYVGSGGSSLVDLVITNECMLKYFSSFIVEEPNILSDHCVVEFSILSNSHPDNVNDNGPVTTNGEHLNSCYKWNKDNAETYSSNLASPDIQLKLQDLCDSLSNSPSAADIDESVLG